MFENKPDFSGSGVFVTRCVTRPLDLDTISIPALRSPTNIFLVYDVYDSLLTSNVVLFSMTAQTKWLNVVRQIVATTTKLANVVQSQIFTIRLSASGARKIVSIQKSQPVISEQNSSALCLSCSTVMSANNSASPRNATRATKTKSHTLPSPAILFIDGLTELAAYVKI